MFMILHLCCAPCALPIIEHLLIEQKVKDITLYFYNPNIFPKQEYQKRLKDVEKIAKIYKLKLIKGLYEHDKWLDYIKKLLPKSPEKYPENSERCLKCFEFRLENTAQCARKMKFKEFGATLSVSLYKNTRQIKRIGKQLARKYGLIYRPFNLNPKKAYQASLKISKNQNLYRQKYCGCEFSMI